VADEPAARLLRERLRDGDVELFDGEAGVVEAATHGDPDLMLSGIVGAAGLAPTLAALRAGIDIAFVNKEVLVVAGELVVRTAQGTGARILPVDSEISAVFQCLQGSQRRDDLHRIYLTASGGPFRSLPGSQFAAITPQQALNHPNWSMGSKVTIDSATLMNKGLEVIEARWLFDLHLDQVAVVVHPQSIVHSYVEFVDGSVIAQMGVPDMRVPIQYALTYPQRMPTPTPRLDLMGVGSLTFEPADVERFPCLGLAYEAARIGGSMPAVLSGADEVAVDAFLIGRIRFDEIPAVVEATMAVHEPVKSPPLEALFAVDAWAREVAAEMVAKRAA